MVNTRRKRRADAARRRVLVVAAIIMFSLLVGRSEAYLGYGGFVLGLGLPETGRDANFLNSWSLENRADALASRPQNHTAPVFTSREDQWQQRYDPATREAMINRVARNPGRQMSTANLPQPRPAAPTPRASQPAAVPAPQPVFLLHNFFDKSRRFVWLANAPTSGDLGEKQEIAAQAILAVFNEYELNGLASLLSVTSAREKLLDYGRPALELVTNQTTPAIADSFHSFLLAVYAQLGLAATVPKAR